MSMPTLRARERISTSCTLRTRGDVRNRYDASSLSTCGNPHRFRGRTRPDRPTGPRGAATDTVGAPRTRDDHRDVQPEGRRRQDDVDHQPWVRRWPNTVAECSWWISIPKARCLLDWASSHHDLELTVHNLLVEPRVSIDDVLMRTRVDGLDLLPSNIDLSAAEIQLVTEVGREQTLGRVLHPVLDRYDYVLIDCQPSLGLLTVNALACADSVIIPMECEYFSLRGLALLNDTVEKVHDRLNPKLELAGIVVTMFDARTLHAREVMARVVEVFGDVVYDTVINRTVPIPRNQRRR